ncbi:hypothetical protein V1264_003692 [Littorina saxatilis]
MQRLPRVKKELQMLLESPPHGISCYPVSDNITQFEAKILGGEGTPYFGGVFKVQIDLPERYPFEPPKVQFLTPIYHPNVDNAGRICLDTLKMPPKGAWKPCMNLMTVLTSLQLLMAQPNPDDALMADVATEFKHSPELFRQKAVQFTALHANQGVVQPLQQQVSVAGTASSGNSAFLHHSQLPGSVSSGKRPPPSSSPALSDLTNKKMKT